MTKDRGNVERRVQPDGAQLNASPHVAWVVIAEERWQVSADRPFVFGRADAEAVVGLDGTDMGISAVAGSVESAWGVWWVVNQSTKRPLLLEHPGGLAQLPLAPGHRYAVMLEKICILVPGAIYTHLVEVILPETYVADLRSGASVLSTGTLAGTNVVLSAREHDAVAALCAGYLEPFPRRREHPNTYEEAARLLGGGTWSGDKVRKAIERVKGRFAAKQNVYFDGPQANYDLAAHLVSNGLLSGEDLARLPGRRT